MADPAITRARRMWADLTGVAIEFPTEGVSVVASAESLLCPPGWLGVVVLAGGAIATVPSDDVVDDVRAVLGRSPVPVLTDADRMSADLPVLDVLGPASLAYLDEEEFRPSSHGAAIATLADVSALLASVPADDADECGLSEITSPAFVVRDGADVVAAAGYRRWAGQAAHISVLTAPGHRDRGLARVAASAAVVDALANDLLPQWRARPEPSRRVARALGFRTIGSQLSLQLGPFADTDPRYRATRLRAQPRSLPASSASRA